MVDSKYLDKYMATFVASLFIIRFYWFSDVFRQGF